MGISGGIFAFVLFLYFIDPDAFDYFRYSFKRERLALSHYIIYLIVFVATVVTIVQLPQLSWVSLIPFSVLLLFTLIYRPYKDPK